MIRPRALRTTDPSLPMTVFARTATPTALEMPTTAAEAVDLVEAVVVLEAPALAVTTSTTALATLAAT